MAEVLALLGRLGAQVLQQQQQGEPEQTICFSLLPPLLGAAVFGVRALALRLSSQQ